MKHKLLLAFLLTLLVTRSENYSQELAAVNSESAGINTENVTRGADDEPKSMALPQESSSEIRVQLGKSLLITAQEPLLRVSVTDATIASAVVVSPTQVLVHGLKAGAGTLILWDNQDRARSFNVSVEVDVNTLQARMRQMFPNETLSVAQSGGSLVLAGNVSSKDVSERAALLAGTFSPSVVNLVRQTQGRQVVMLQVRFAEVDRAAIEQLGVNIFSTGGANTIGAIGTQQFGQTAGNVGAIPPVISRGTDPRAPSLAAGGIGRDLPNTPAVFGLSDLLNVFLFRPDLNLGVTIKALQQRNVLQILAEPNVLAMNGTEASFLAGGEFPFPVVQAGTNNAVTILFKEFGVRLNFTPNIQPDGAIRLQIKPEVSALDFSNALTISGFTVPALATRRTSAEVELRDGQSFAIAGLIDNRLTEIASKIPGLGHIPILGHLFRSRAQNKTNTELLVMVTPRIVDPLAPGQVPALPDFPKDFIDQDRFDGRSGEAPARGVTPPPAVVPAPQGPTRPE